MGPSKKPERRSKGKPVKKDADLIVYDRRLVTNKDRWCRLIGKDPVAPFGYIVSIPFPKHSTELRGLSGHIIRTKKSRGMLLMQVVKTHRTDLVYCIKNVYMDIPTRASGKMRKIVRHCINISSPLPRKVYRKKAKKKDD